LWLAPHSKSEAASRGERPLVQRSSGGKDLPKGEAAGAAVGVKVAAHLRADFRLIMHGSPSLWHAWKWIDETSSAATDPTAQPEQGL